MPKSWPTHQNRGQLMGFSGFRRALVLSPPATDPVGACQTPHHESDKAVIRRGMDDVRKAKEHK